jgi:ribulose-5-phosphate 4-epimerase/fuculose-1-phosphate aldolase
MPDLPAAICDLVIANRILARENVVDAYGHVSIRHPLNPERYLLSCSRSPELVERADILEFDFAGESVDGDTRRPYLERFIHGGIYEARPEINAVVHSHADDVLPFSVSSTPLEPVIHNASGMGLHVPVWDIRDAFGDTSLLVATVDHGRDLAKGLGGASVVLMRGHGFSAAGRTLLEAVGISVYVPKNARVLMNAIRLGQVKGLSAGEIERIRCGPHAHDLRRAWEYWSRRAGCVDLL